MRVSKIDQMKTFIRKTDQLLILYIAVDPFFKRTLSLWLIFETRFTDYYFIGKLTNSEQLLVVIQVCLRDWVDSLSKT